MERKWISFRLGVPHVRYLHRSAWRSCIISYICLALRICDCTRYYHFIPALYIVQKYMQLLYGLFFVYESGVRIESDMTGLNRHKTHLVFTLAITVTTICLHCIVV